MLYSGRELAHIDVGADVLNRVIAQLEDAAKVESPPKREGRRMSALLAPK